MPLSGFTHIHCGQWVDLAGHVTELGPLRKTGKLFLAERLGSTAAEVSLNRIEPGDGYEFLHRHRTHEEIYLVIAGHGDMLVDGEQLALTEGSAVRVAPSVARSIRAARATALTYLCIQAVEGTLRHRTVTDGELVDGPVEWR